MCVCGEAKSNFQLAVTPNTLQVKCDERLLLRPIAARRCSLWRSRVCEVETLQWKIVALKVEVKDRLTEINFESRGSPWGLALSEGSVEQCNQKCLSTATCTPQHFPYKWWLWAAWFSSSPPISQWCLSSADRPPAAGLQNTYDAYSSSAGSMVLLPHINIECQAQNSYAVFPTPPQKQNELFNFQLMPVP